MSQQAERRVPGFARALNLLLLVAVGFLTYQVVFVRAPLWFTLGRPRSVSLEELRRVTGVSPPVHSRLVGSRYRKGLRTSALFAELALPYRDVRWLEENALPGTTLSFSVKRTRDLPVVREDAPGWPEAGEMLVAGAIRHTEVSQQSRRVILALPRSPGPEERLYVYWTETQ